MKMGHKIKIARTEAGFTQRSLAAAMKVSMGLVGAWENHTKAPGRDNLAKLARVVGRPSVLRAGDCLRKLTAECAPFLDCVSCAAVV